MGIPIIDAPCEAEAQCAEFVKTGLAYASATEDMDSLTFGTKTVLRKLAMPQSSKEPIIEIDINKVLSSLKLTMDQFIDFCILCGCDYCEKIEGIGPKNAIKLIQKYNTIEEIIKNLPPKYTVHPLFVEILPEVRNLFKTPSVNTELTHLLKFEKINEEGLIDFLVTKKNFNKERVLNVIDKITNKLPIKGQPTITSFFKHVKT